MKDQEAHDGDHYYAFPPGSKLQEFEIEAVLGSGGFGITYRAMDTFLDEAVAIKEFLPNEIAVRASDQTVRAKSSRDQTDFQTGLISFLNEARVMARLRHPNIVHVRRFFELHGTGYIVQDYEKGKTLGSRLLEGPVSEIELRKLLHGLLDGLEVIHDHAILHRDIKPDNIIMRPDGTPVLIDFGAAREFLGRHSKSITAIVSGAYAPPEQWGAGGQQGPWSDLYALGATAYRCVTGAAPPVSLQRLRNDSIVPATVAARGRYAHDLLELIDWMLELDETKRPSSVRVVREALDGSSHSQPAPADMPAAEIPVAAQPSPPRRRRTAVIASVLAILVAIAAGSYGFYLVRQQQIETELKRKQAAEEQRLTTQLHDIGFTHDRLEQFLVACGAACPEELAREAHRRLDQIAAEEKTYQAAGDDMDRLKAYQRECRACAFKDRAAAKISKITRQREAAKARLEAVKARLEAANQVIRDACDRLAATPGDSDLPAGISGVSFAAIQPPQAVAACRRAHDVYPDDPRIAYQLGRALHAAKQYSEAIPLYRLAADRGNRNAVTNLGVLYEGGMGVTKDHAEALRFFRQGSDLGSPISMTNLGKMYLNGEGVAKNAEEAARLFQMAASLENADAMTSLGNLYRYGTGVTKDPGAAMRLYRRAADLGDSFAMLFLGGMYQGGEGIAKDNVTAVAFYRRSADIGNVAAIVSLGGMYQNGFGTAKDEAEAARLYQRAADMNNTAGMVNLGVMYEHGTGVRKDPGEAVRLFQRAADLGEPGAMNNLGIFYQSGIGVRRDDAEAIRWFRKASDLGYGDGTTNLGAAYANGRGVRRDDKKAAELLRKAIAQGSTSAKTSLKFMIDHGRAR